MAISNETTWNSTMDSDIFPSGTFMPFYLHSTGMAVVYIVCYGLVLLLCVGGNVLVSLVVLFNRNMRSITNLFILNLAISDLLIGLFCIPTTLIDSLISGWPFGQITCTMSNLAQGVSVSASVFTLVAIAVDRFTGIVYPFRSRMKPKTALLTILLIWMLAFAIICPSTATLTVIRLEGTYMVHGNQTYPVFVCYEKWPRPDMRQVYTTVIFVHVYLAPLLLISVMYGCVAVKLSTNLRRVGLPDGRRRRSQSRAKVINMLIMVAVLFMVSWLPLWTLMLVTDYSDLDREQIDFLSSYLFPVAHWLAFSNSGINPIIYGLFNKNFRRGFQAVVACSSCNPTATVVTTVCNRGNGLIRAPKISPQAAQGILLEDINAAARNRVITAWER